jgi:hypothetical protein
VDSRFRGNDGRAVKNSNRWYKPIDAARHPTPFAERYTGGHARAGNPAGASRVLIKIFRTIEERSFRSGADVTSLIMFYDILDKPQKCLMACATPDLGRGVSATIQGDSL